MTERTRASWLVYALGALCAGAIAAAILVVGPAAGSQPAATRTATAARGVVQSTVSGSGNLQAANQLNLGFKTAGTVTHIYVTQGQHVVEGQLLATLDPQSAEVTLEQSKAALQSAEANLASEEESGGASASGQGSGASGTASASAASLGRSSVGSRAIGRQTAYTARAATTPTGAPGSTTPPASTPAPSTTSTSPTPTPTKSTTAPATRTPSARTKHPSGGTTTTTSHEHETPNASSNPSSSSSTVSQATREANLASARATVRSDRLTVQGDEQAVQDTKLYAPESGTIASLSGQVGEVVSGSGTTRASSSTGSSSGSGSASGRERIGRRLLGRPRAPGSGSTSSAGSSSSSSSPFAVLSDLSSMQLVVALSESEIGNVRSGQIATVTIEALAGRKVAAHVGEVAILSTTSSGVVSYDVTFQLDQLEAGLKPGMSATAEVVVKQAEGINVPTSAITDGTVTLAQGSGHGQVRRRVVTGLRGNSSTIVLSGLKAGETVVLPSAGGTGASLTSQLRSRLGRSGGAGGLGSGLSGGGAGGGGGLPAGGFFRGGG